MSYKVKTIKVFERQAERLTRKYPSLKNEITILIKKLKENPEMGTPIGKKCFKIRLAISSNVPYMNQVKSLRRIYTFAGFVRIVW